MRRCTTAFATSASRNSQLAAAAIGLLRTTAQCGLPIDKQEMATALDMCESAPERWAVACVLADEFRSVFVTHRDLCCRLAALTTSKTVPWESLAWHVALKVYGISRQAGVACQDLPPAFLMAVSLSFAKSDLVDDALRFYDDIVVSGRVSQKALTSARLNIFYTLTVANNGKRWASALDFLRLLRREGDTILTASMIRLFDAMSVWASWTAAACLVSFAAQQRYKNKHSAPNLDPVAFESLPALSAEALSVTVQGFRCLVSIDSSAAQRLLRTARLRHPRLFCSGSPLDESLRAIIPDGDERSDPRFSSQATRWRTKTPPPRGSPSLPGAPSALLSMPVALQTFAHQANNGRWSEALHNFVRSCSDAALSVAAADELKFRRVLLHSIMHSVGPTWRTAIAALHALEAARKTPITSFEVDSVVSAALRQSGWEAALHVTGAAERHQSGIVPVISLGRIAAEISLQWHQALRVAAVAMGLRTAKLSDFERLVVSAAAACFRDNNEIEGRRVFALLPESSSRSPTCEVPCRLLEVLPTDLLSSALRDGLVKAEAASYLARQVSWEKAASILVPCLRAASASDNPCWSLSPSPGQESQLRFRSATHAVVRHLLISASETGGAPAISSCLVGLVPDGRFADRLGSLGGSAAVVGLTVHGASEEALELLTQLLAAGLTLRATDLRSILVAATPGNPDAEEVALKYIDGLDPRERGKLSTLRLILQRGQTKGLARIGLSAFRHIPVALLTDREIRDGIRCSFLAHSTAGWLRALECCRMGQRSAPLSGHVANTLLMYYPDCWLQALDLVGAGDNEADFRRALVLHAGKVALGWTL